LGGQMGRSVSLPLVPERDEVGNFDVKPDARLLHTSYTGLWVMREIAKRPPDQDRDREL